MPSRSRGGIFCLGYGWMFAALCRLARPLPLARRGRIDHGHLDALGGAHRHRGGIEILQTKYVDPEMVGRGALAMKGVNAAARTEEMLRAMRIPLVGREHLGAAEDAELAFMHLRHQRVSAAAKRAVARRQFLDRGIDSEAHRAAMARSPIG